MSVPKSKNPKIKNKNKNKIYNTNIYYFSSRHVCISLFFRPVKVNRPWQDKWVIDGLTDEWWDRWMKWCFTTSFTICNSDKLVGTFGWSEDPSIAWLVPSTAEDPTCWKKFLQAGNGAENTKEKSKQCFAFILSPPPFLWSDFHHYSNISKVQIGTLINKNSWKISLNSSDIC